MTNGNPLWGEERKIVSTRLYRSEFANIMKICKDENNKSINTKLREMVKKEVNEKVGKTGYDRNKINEFQTHTIWEYSDRLVIENICKVNLVDKTDKNFVQIGRRFLFDEEMFLAGSNISPRLPRLGMDVAIWEIDFLINKLIENKDIEKIKFDEEIKEFPKHVYNFNEAVILISTKFYVEVFTKLSLRIDYDKKYPRLDGQYKIIPVSERILKNKIIIIDKNAILWEKQKFNNEFTNKEEKLDIKIKPGMDWKVDITVRSVNKIKYLDPKLIKILEVE